MRVGELGAGRLVRDAGHLEAVRRLERAKRGGERIAMQPCLGGVLGEVPEAFETLPDPRRLVDRVEVTYQEVEPTARASRESVTSLVVTGTESEARPSESVVP